MKKKFSMWAMMMAVAICVLLPGITVQAATGKTSVAVSAGNVDIGDTVTVTVKATDDSGAKAYATMSLSYDSSILQFVSCSTTYGGGGSSVTAATDSFTVTLKAIAQGKSNISVKGSDGVVFDTNESLDSMAGSSASVTVNNAAGTTDGGNTTVSANTSTGTSTANTSTSDGNTKQSADNSLKSLTISPGTLSPSFSGSTTKYTATVGNDVTELAVSATPVNDKASVESVTGNTNLAVGNNDVKIVVKAENGVTATYTITVTRQATQTTAEEEETKENEDTPAVITEETLETVSVDGATYYISGDFSGENIPADFEETTITYHEKEYKGVHYNKGSVSMLYLIAAEEGNTSGSFFIYDEARDVLYPFVQMCHGEHYVIALLAPADYEMPDTWQQTSFTTVDGVKVTAYQILGEENESVSDFYTFYAINHDGTEGWYQYDAFEGTYQRINTVVTEEESTSDSDLAYLQEEYNKLSEQYKQEQAFSRNVIAIVIFVAAVLLIIIINLLVRRAERETDFEDFEDDFDDEEHFDIREDIVEEEDFDVAEDIEEEEDFSGEEEYENEKPKKTVKKEQSISKKIQDSKDKDLEIIDFNDL